VMPCSDVVKTSNCNILRWDSDRRHTKQIMERADTDIGGERRIERALSPW